MKTVLFLFVFAVLTVSAIYTQPTQQWVDRYNGPVNMRDQGVAIVTDNQGNVYSTGYITHAAGNLQSYFTAKYNNQGIRQWANTYLSPNGLQDIPTDIKVDNLGNVYVTGTSFRNSVGYDWSTVKYNSSGTLLWAKQYGFNSSDYAQTLLLDDSGNVYITGHVYFSSTNYSAAIIKYNSAGDSVWVKKYDGPGTYVDIGLDIAFDNTGNIILTGYTGVSTSAQDILVVKFNPAGTQQWAQTWNGVQNLNDRGNKICTDNSGNIYITGHTQISVTNSDIITLKYNSSGTLQWTKIYGGSMNTDDIVYSLNADSSGNSHITGVVTLTGGLSRIFTIKYSPAGNELWNQIYSAGTGGSLSSVLDNSGNIYLTGNFSSALFIMKYSSGGVFQWIQSYNRNGLDYGADIILDTAGNVFVTGVSDSVGGGSPNYDIITLKYSQLTGITPVSNEIPKQYTLSQNYPNPFNPATEIRFQIPQAELVTLEVYNALGQNVESLVNGELNAGTYEISFNSENYSSGIYFYRLKAGSYSETRKMILIK